MFSRVCCAAVEDEATAALPGPLPSPLYPLRRPTALFDDCTEDFMWLMSVFSDPLSSFGPSVFERIAESPW